MQFKVKLLKWSAGRPVAILNKETASRLALSVNDRILIKKNNKKIIAVLDVISGLVKKNEIALSVEASKILKLKSSEKISISLASHPESVQLIHKKLDCKTLKKKDLEKIIRDITINALTEAEIAYFVSAIYKCGMSIQETIDVTRIMARTGKKLRFKNKIVVDKHSIGGVSGRTTPIIVSICAAAGLIMPKTSSRAITSPAGTADAIETVCNVSLTIKQIRKVIKKTNACFVWGGTLGLAPADDKLIQIEKLLNIDPEPQLLASILAKKLAVGAKYVIIDIPYGKGAKVDKKKGLMLKRKFEIIGGKLGLKVKCILNKAEGPRGNGLGPVLEMIDVINVLKREDNSYQLRNVSLLLAGEILELAGLVKKGYGKLVAEEILDSGKAFKKFKQIVRAQGGNKKNLDKLSPGKYKKDILSKKNFRINSIDSKALNHVAIAAGCPINKSAGIYLYKHLRDKVKKGERILTIYAETSSELKEAINLYENLKPIK